MYLQIRPWQTEVICILRKVAIRPSRRHPCLTQKWICESLSPEFKRKSNRLSKVSSHKLEKLKKKKEKYPADLVLQLYQLAAAQGKYVID